MNNPNYIRNGWYNRTKYELSKLTGDYRKMHEAYLFRDSISNLNLKEALNRNVALREAEFYFNKKQLAEKSQRTWIYISVIVFSFMIIISLLFFIYRQKSQMRVLKMERELQDFVSQRAMTVKADKAAIGRLEKEISDLKNEIEVREKSLDFREQSVKEREEIIKEISSNIKKELSEDLESRKRLVGQLLAEELEPVAKIVPRYFGRNSSDALRAEFRNELSKAVRRINSNGVFNRMETLADYMNGGLISELRNEVTKLDARDIKYLVFSLAGCSTNMIALLLGTTPEHCRNIKTRMISKIKKNGSEKALRLLNQWTEAEKIN